MLHWRCTWWWGREQGYVYLNVYHFHTAAGVLFALWAMTFMAILAWAARMTRPDIGLLPWLVFSALLRHFAYEFRFFLEECYVGKQNKHPLERVLYVWCPRDKLGRWAESCQICVASSVTIEYLIVLQGYSSVTMNKEFLERKMWGGGQFFILICPFSWPFATRSDISMQYQLRMEVTCY